MNKTITYSLNGGKTEKKLNVREHVPHTVRAACARIIAEAVVSERGGYQPDMLKIHMAIFILTNYADFKFPAKWGDDDVADFVDHHEAYKNILSIIDSAELEEMTQWTADLIEYRKHTYAPTGVNQALWALVDFVKESMGDGSGVPSGQVTDAMIKEAEKLIGLVAQKQELPKDEKEREQGDADC